MTKYLTAALALAALGLVGIAPAMAQRSNSFDPPLASAHSIYSPTLNGGGSYGYNLLQEQESTGQQNPRG
jgi:hypothetical protein